MGCNRKWPRIIPEMGANACHQACMNSLYMLACENPCIKDEGTEKNARLSYKGSTLANTQRINCPLVLNFHV